MGQYQIEQFRALRQAPGDKAAADPLIACRDELWFEPFRQPGPGADHSKTAGRTDRRGQRPAGGATIGAERMG
jgi:hypothetical protein